MTRETLTWTRERAGSWALESPKTRVATVTPHIAASGATGHYRAEIDIETTPPQGWVVRGTVQAARNAVESMLAKTWEADRYTIAPKPAPLPPGAYTATVQSVTARKIKGRLVVTKSLAIDGHPDRPPMGTRERY